MLDEKKLARLALFENAAADPARYTVQDTERGTKVIQGLPIFKAGRFKDSLGEEATWTVEQLAQMASNFEQLRDAGIFPNVPVRVDHSWSVDDVCGYFVNVYVVGDRLVADIEITEPDAFEKFDRGTYRSRSIEIGAYEDNDGVTHWPTVMGLAFVDIPAVEGLHRGSHKVGCYRVSQEEPTVPTENKNEQQPPALHTFKLRGEDTTDYAKVQAHVAALEGENDALKTRNEALETFAKEQATATRHNYVAGLAGLKKIAATQIDGLKALVETMSDEQFKAFQDAYEKAPEMSLLGQHGGLQNGNPTGEPRAEDDERAVLEETLAMHRRAGMSEDELKKTSSYRKLAALNNGH